MEYNSVTNLRWANAEKTAIDCDVDFVLIDEATTPFTASQTDSSAHGRDIFQQCVAGNFGPIADYAPPPPLSDEALAFSVRFERDQKLKNSDWTQLPDVPPETQALWAVYRQLLRDITTQEGFPKNIDWPIEP